MDDENYYKIVGLGVGVVIIVIIIIVFFVKIKPTIDQKQKVKASAPTPAPTPPAPTAAPGPITATLPKGVSPTGEGVPRCTAVPNDPNSYICESYTDGTLVTSKIIQ